MSSFHFIKSSLSSPSLPSSSSSSSKSSKSSKSFLYSKFTFCVSGNGLYNRFPIKNLNNTRLTTSCKIGDKDNQTNGDDAPESLFMKELKRRGMTPTSLLEDTKTTDEDQDQDQQPRASEPLPRNGILNQREQSMALNSEGLEGLIPRGKQLLTLGGTFFLAFGPLILLTVAIFLVLYLYFGPTFVHDGSVSRTSLPQYIDPYQLLEEDRINKPVNLKL